MKRIKSQNPLNKFYLYTAISRNTLVTFLRCCLLVFSLFSENDRVWWHLGCDLYLDREKQGCLSSRDVDPTALVLDTLRRIARNDHLEIGGRCNAHVLDDYQVSTKTYCPLRSAHNHKKPSPLNCSSLFCAVFSSDPCKRCIHSASYPLSLSHRCLIA